MPALVTSLLTVPASTITHLNRRVKDVFYSRVPPIVSDPTTTEQERNDIAQPPLRHNNHTIIAATSNMPTLCTRSYKGQFGPV